MQKDLLTKIEQIIALQERAATKDEAAAAAAALQRLLTRHNLEEADVRARLGGKQAESNVGFTKHVVPAATWLHALWRVVANANDADVVYSPARKGAQPTITVFAHGDKHETIKRLVESLAVTVQRLAPKEYREYVKRQKQRGHWAEPSRTWTNSYRCGFVYGVELALNEAKQTVEREYEGSSALVLAAQEEVANALAVVFPKLQQRSARVSGSGYDRGQAAGYAHGGNRAQIRG